METTTTKTKEDYPGLEYERVKKVTKKDVEQDVKYLNNNPRNDDDKD